MREKIEDDFRYEFLQNNKLKEWEEKCNFCGHCCGVFEGEYVRSY